MSDDVRAAAERLIAEGDMGQQHIRDVEAVARAALEAGQEVARLREALLEIADMDASDDDPYYSSAASLQAMARAALSTPVKPEKERDCG